MIPHLLFWEEYEVHIIYQVSTFERAKLQVTFHSMCSNVLILKGSFDSIQFSLLTSFFFFFSLLSLTFESSFFNL